jgi:hypothetical protein
MNIVPISPEAHKNLKVKVNTAPKHVEGQHIVPLTAPEFMQAATSFPIVLIKDPQADRFRAVAVLGMKEGQNLIYSNEKWQGVYMPSSIQRVPFAIAPDPVKEKTLTGCIDVDSPLVSETEGEALFDEKGEESEYLKNVQKFLFDLYNKEVATERFISRLVELELIQEIQVNLAFEDQSKNKKVTGMFNINDQKLRELTDEQALELHKAGYNAPIHAMLGSVGQFNRLINLNNEQGEERIVGLQIQLAQKD